MSKRAYQFKTVQYMTAGQKQHVLQAWRKFLTSGLKLEHFTEPLYHHLNQHCNFIAHYNRHGFYSVYFNRGEDTIRFLGQFDRAKGLVSVEYRMTHWFNNPDYADLNEAMVAEAEPLLPALYAAATGQQEAADVAQANALLAKHGRPSVQ